MVRPLESSGLGRWALGLLVWGLALLFLFFPLLYVFLTALQGGLPAYLEALTPETLKALRLTLLAAGLAGLLNLLFGLLLAFALVFGAFPGKGLLLGLASLPLSVSPVVAGLMLLLAYGKPPFGLLGGALEGLGVQVVFALPGIVLATAFVTLPVVLREVLPHLEGLKEEVLAAYALGASGAGLFRLLLVRLGPALRLGLLLTLARGLGEFGAVSLVSGKIPGVTATLTIQVELFYQSYALAQAFAAASLLALLGLLGLFWEVKRVQPRRD